MKNILLAIFLIFTQCLSAQTFSKNASVIVTSTPSLSPLRITVNWTSYATSTGYTVYRKVKSSSSWGSPIATLSGTTLQYVDNSISQNTYYEYKITRTSSVGTGYGYTTGSVNLSEVEYRGKMILVVDNTFSLSLSSEISQLQSDLTGDGWIVTRIDVSRSSTPASVRTQIQNIYNQDPSSFKSVFLLGHIPVYRSGPISPDGHESIPWSCDTYYGEMNSTWSSSQTSLPSDMELEVGRVDMYNLPSFSETEIQLMSKYLTKLHNFKVRSYIPQNRMLIQDNLDWAGYPLASTGYRTSGLVGGVSNLTDIGYYGFPIYSSRMSDSYLFGYGGGGGVGYNNSDNIATTSVLSSTPCNIIFNMTFGSYFGNWDCSSPVPGWNNNTDNLLKSFLASGKCLTSTYPGVPSAFYHHMGLGDPIGYSSKISQNNRTSSSTYQPQNGGWQGQNYTTIHVSLLGDPTLRMVYVNQPSGFNVSRSGSTTTFNWTEASQVNGYHIYEINDGLPPVRVNPSVITGNSYVSNSTSSSNYMIRSVKLENLYSGSYNNLSIGVTSGVEVSQPPFITMNVFLGGPYVLNIMNDDLRLLGLVPLSDPYPSSGYVHKGTPQPSTINGLLLGQSGNSSIVDWVVIELRNSISPSVIVQTIPCLVRKDGVVVNTFGSSQIDIPSSGSYYVSIKHRNHLGCMTSSPIMINSNGVNIDFTNSLTPTYGTNARNQVGSQMVLYPGNSNFDNVIKYTGSNNDRDNILVRIGGVVPTNIVSGYFLEDINMDGLVKYTGTGNDRDIILVSIGGIIPTNFVLEQLP